MSQLRGFSAYTKTAAQSLFTNACNLITLDGNYAGAGNEYLQIHDKASVATVGNVPIASFLLSAAGPLPSIFEALGPIGLTLGLSIGISTTEATYTASASSYSIFGNVEEWETQISGLSIAGDLTTGIDTLQVWANVSGPKTIYRIQVLDITLSTTRYLMLFGKDAPADGDRPIRQWKLLDGCNLDLRFGLGGIWTRQNINGTLHQGCTFQLSDSAGTLVYSGGGAGETMALRVSYKTSGSTS